MKNKENKLTTSDIRDLVLEAGVGLIPCIGGPLATVLFGAKQTLALKRVESFLHELAETVKELQIKFPELNEERKEQLADLIMKVTTHVESESRQEKRHYFKLFLINSFRSTGDVSFDIEEFFLDALNTFNLIDIKILSNLMRKPEQIKSTEISIVGIDQHAIFGSIGRLNTHGLVSIGTTGLTFGGLGDKAFNEHVQISSFGKTFYNFCLKDPLV